MFLGCKWAELQYTQCISSCKQAETVHCVNRWSVVCGRDQRRTSWMPRPHIRVHWERRRAKVQCAPVEMWRENRKHTARVCTDYLPLTSLEITEVKDRFVVCPVKRLPMPLCLLMRRWLRWNTTYFYRDCARAFFIKVRTWILRIILYDVKTFFKRDIFSK